jgi:WD40 repeat protein
MSKARRRCDIGSHSTVTSLLFDPNREILISGSADGTIMRWDLKSEAD